MGKHGATPLRAGAARVDLGPPTQGIGMMGWGMLHNVVDGASTPIHARAFVVESGGARVAIVVCEIAMITQSVKDAVVERLESSHPEFGLHDANLLLCATHTHSAPGGFGHDHFYNISIPGHVPDALDWIVDGVVDAVVGAYGGLRPARVRFVESEIASGEPVVFNRSMESFNLNKDPGSPLDRTMRMLCFEDDRGQLLGSINWFAVHCTSVHSDNRLVHFDNKGYAAQMLEDESADAGFVAAFAQGAAGDVSPNFKKYDSKPWTRGTHVDDDESARDNGRMQFEHALRLQDRRLDGEEIHGPVEYAHRYVDFSAVAVDRRFTDGVEGRRTGPAEIGVAMFFGTAEGPGLPRRFRFVQSLARRVRSGLVRLGVRNRAKFEDRRAVQGDKVTVVEAGHRRVLGAARLGHLDRLGRFHPALDQFFALDQGGYDDPKSWIQQILPVQILRIGSVAIVAVPAEFTTTSGRRLRATVHEALAGQGVDHVVLTGYANAYAGYVTTHEEYENQDYEGASTLFGRWTLGAYQSCARDLAGELSAERTEPNGPRPPPVGPIDLKGRVFVPS